MAVEKLTKVPVSKDFYAEAAERSYRLAHLEAGLWYPSITADKVKVKEQELMQKYFLQFTTPPL